MRYVHKPTRGHLSIMEFYEQIKKQKNIFWQIAIVQLAIIFNVHT